MAYPSLSPTSFTQGGIPVWRTSLQAIPNHPEFGAPRLRQVCQVENRPARFASSLMGLAIGGCLVVFGAILCVTMLVQLDAGNLLLALLLGIPLLRKGLPIVREAHARLLAANEQVTVTAYIRGYTFEIHRYLGQSGSFGIGEEAFSSIALTGCGQPADEPRVLEVMAGDVPAVIVGSATDPDHMALFNLWVSRMAHRLQHELAQGKSFAWVAGLVLNKYGVTLKDTSYPFDAICVQDGPEEWCVASMEGPYFSLSGSIAERNWWVGYALFLALAGSRGKPSGHAGGRTSASGSPDRASFDRQRVKDLAVLGLDEAASEADIRTSFRRMAKVHHPDRFAQSGPEAVKDAEQSFMLLREAFERLTAVRRRAS